MRENEIMLRNMTSVYIRSGGSMLMLYRIGSRVVEPSWCGIGGHFEQRELNDPKACALRELWEEAAIGEDRLENFSLRYVTLRLKKGEIRQNYYYFADLKGAPAPLPACSEGALRWIKEDKILSLPMPLTAKQMLCHYMEAGRYTQEIYSGTTCRDGMVFAVLKEF